MACRIWLTGHSLPTPDLEQMFLKLSVVEHQFFVLVYSCPGQVYSSRHMQLIPANSVTANLTYALLSNISTVIMHLNNTVMLITFLEKIINTYSQFMYLSCCGLATNSSQTRDQPHFE